MADEVFDAGCADYIIKPVDITQLVRRVDANLAMAKRVVAADRHRAPGGRTA
jgi:DNA-binding response OmpR family regulator